MVGSKIQLKECVRRELRKRGDGGFVENRLQPRPGPYPIRIVRACAYILPLHTDNRRPERPAITGRRARVCEKMFS